MLVSLVTMPFAALDRAILLNVQSILVLPQRQRTGKCALSHGKLKCSGVVLQAEGYDKGLEQRVTNLEDTVSQLQK